MNDFISLMPEHFHSSRIFTELLRVKAKQYNKLDYDIEDFNNQLFVDTATWGLEVWEREYGLPVNYGRSLSDRRGDVKAKMRGSRKVSASLLEDILQEYYEEVVKVGFNGRISLEFPIEGELGRRIAHMQEVIEGVKPAHLGYDINLKMRDSKGAFYFGAYGEVGEDVTIYPRVIQDMKVETKAYPYMHYEGIVEEVTVGGLNEWNLGQ